MPPKMISLVLVLLLVLRVVVTGVVSHNLSSEPFCGPGTFLEAKDGSVLCKPCADYTFMEEEKHRRNRCKPCLYVSQDPYYTITSKCTPTRDAQVNCSSGYYRDFMDRVEPCKKCYDCSSSGDYEAEPCSKYSNTKCCQEKGVDCRPQPEPELTTTKPESKLCSEKKLQLQGENVTIRSSHGCLAGESFFCRDNDNFVCHPCPIGSFMNETGHLNEVCIPCTRTPKNARMLKECTAVSDAVYGIPSMEGSDNTLIIILCVLIPVAIVGIGILIVLAYRSCRKRKSLNIELLEESVDLRDGKLGASAVEDNGKEN